MRKDIKDKAIELAIILGWTKRDTDIDDNERWFVFVPNKYTVKKKFNPKYENELSRKYSSISYLLDEVSNKCSSDVSKISTINNIDDTKLVLLDSLINYYKSLK